MVFRLTIVAALLAGARAGDLLQTPAFAYSGGPHALSTSYHLRATPAFARYAQIAQPIASTYHATPIQQPLIQTPAFSTYSLSSPVLRTASLAPAPIYRTAQLAPAPIYRTAQLAPAPIYRTAQLEPAAIYRTAQLAPAPIYRTAPLAPAPIYTTAQLAAAPIYRTAQLAPAPIYNNAQLAPAQIYNTAQLAPVPIYKTAQLAPAPILKATPLAAPPTAKTAVAEEYDQNPHYEFGYEVHDSLTGDVKSQVESRTGDVVQGSYSLNDPDGTRRTVDYVADPINGFNAVVRKEPLAVAAKAVVAAPAIAKVATPLAPAAYIH